jgi:hypothetical protein
MQAGVARDLRVPCARTLHVLAARGVNVAFGPTGADVPFVTGAFEQWKPPYPGVVYR